MKPGPRPIASNLKEFRGNPGHRPLNADEPKPDLATHVPEPPRKLKGESRREWDRVAEHLVKTRVLALQELSLLASYCTLHAAFVKAETRGELLTASLISQYRTFAAEFGLTPSSRSRIKAGNGKEEENPFAKYTKRKRA